jgi:hypothetical protein
LNPALCDDVSILNVKVFNSPNAQNSDALDLESCHRAIISGCIFDVGDDGISLKSGKDAAGRRIGMPTQDVLIEGCTVYHAHGGFTIGSEMSGGVRNIRVNNCTFAGTNIVLRFNGAAKFVKENASARVKLRATIKDGGVCSFSFAIGDEFVPVPQTFVARKGVWIGAKLGLYSSKLFENAPAGHVEIDYFRFA